MLITLRTIYLTSNLTSFNKDILTKDGWKLQPKAWTCNCVTIVEIAIEMISAIERRETVELASLHEYSFVQKPPKSDKMVAWENGFKMEEEVWICSVYLQGQDKHALIFHNTFFSLN